MKDIRDSFIKDSDGVYRRGNFYLKEGKIYRSKSIKEASLVPKEDVKEVNDTFVTLGEAIRSVLSYSTTIGQPVRTSDIFIDKVGNNYKPNTKFTNNTVAYVTSSNNVYIINTLDVTAQDDLDNLRIEDKDTTTDPKETKEFISNSKNKEFKNIEEITQEELHESNIKESDATPEFLEDLKNLYNKHCRIDIKDIHFEGDDNDIIIIEYGNGQTQKIDITADSNLSAIFDIAREILKKN